MTTVTRRHRRGLALFSIFSSIAIAAALLAPRQAVAQAQTADQQACLKVLYKSGAKLAKTQGKENAGCIKTRQKTGTSKLGDDSQTKTVDACLTNDVKGKIAKALVKHDAVVSGCVATPDFGSGGGARISGAALTGSRGILRDLYGANMHALMRNEAAYDDENGADCHTDSTKALNKLNDTLWKELGAAAKASLAGKKVPQALSANDLAAAVTAALTADAKGKIQKTTDKLTAAITATCGATAQPMYELFRGRCGVNPTGAQLAACAVASVRCRFARAAAGATDLALDADTFDDGAANGSCLGFASAREITDSGELVTGPLADGQIGDYIIENEYARYVIQRAGVRDIYSVGGFGGNLIDAELVGNPGMDNFLEIQPAVNIETVINAETLEVVNDGADGGPAVIRTCGPDDILDFVNASTVVEDILPFPDIADDVDQEVEGCTEYTLEPDATYLQMKTTLFNLDTEQLGMYAGDYLNAAGEVEQWVSGDAGIGVRLTADNMGVFSYFGYGEAEGVDYGITHIESDGSDSPAQAATNTSTFSTSGVSYILHGQSVLSALLAATPTPTFQVAAGGSKSFTRYFGVGDGSGANVVNLENAVKGRLAGTVSGCVTVAGVPAPGARVTAGPMSGSNITRVTSTWVVDANGCYEGTLPVGSYGIAAWREGTLYEGGASTPLVHPLTIDVLVPAVRDFDLPEPGIVSVAVVDENSDPVPARVTIVGFDPAPDRVFSAETGWFRDRTDVHPFGIVRAVYTDAAGTAAFDVEPGTYRVYVSRGAEYSLYQAPLTVTAGMTSNVAAEIARVIDTPGFVSSDHHVHAIASADSRVSNADRVRQFAGEGVDNVIMTDHHSHTDLNPRIADLGFSAFLTSTIGEEITTWDTGHYNAYPLLIDSTRPSGGSTDWGGAAPAGQDFASLGSYILTPAEVHALATTGPTSTADTVIQINHIDSHFVPMQIDTSLVPPQSFLDGPGKLRFRMDPSSGNLFHHFEALEIWNGHNRNHQNQFLNQRIGVWFNHLNQGLITTGIADTDTHAFANLETAGARSWSAAATDDPALLDVGDVAQSVLAGRVTTGQGLYVQARLVDADIPANVADLTFTGSTLLAASNPVAGVVLEVDVQAPTWAEFDRIFVYANAVTTPVPATPELFSATPTLTLNKGVDFTVTTNNVFPGVFDGSRQEVSLAIPFTNMSEDTWFVVVVKGTDGVSRPLFPVSPADLQQAPNMSLAALTDGNLGQQGVTALGFTNALYADVDGNPGFDAPLAP